MTRIFPITFSGGFGVDRIFLSSVKSIKTCYVKVDAAIQLRSQRTLGFMEALPCADTCYGCFLGVGAHAVSRRVKASSAMARPTAAHRSPGSDGDGCLSSPVMASLMNGLHRHEKKRKKRGPGSPRRINTYARENLPGMLKTPIELQSLLADGSAVSCITGRQRRWRTSSEHRQKDGVDVCSGCMFGRERIYRRRVQIYPDTHTHTHTGAQPLSLRVLTEATL